MYQKPVQPAAIGGVIDDAVKLYRASFRRCAPIAVLGALLSAAMDLFVVAFAHHEGMPLDGLEAALQVYQQPPIIAMGLLQTVMLLALIGALLVIQNAVANGNAAITVGQAIGTGFARLGRFVLATVVYTLVTLIGTLLILPGIYLSNVLSLYPVAMYADDAGAMESLDVSRRLTLGFWWHSASVLGAALAVVLLFALFTDFIVGMLALFGSSGTAGLQSAIQLVGDAADVVVLPIVPAALVALHNDLKLRHP